MQSKGSNIRASNMVSRSRISSLLISLFATFASVYVAGRLWQEAQNRVYMVKELDRITGLGRAAISVDDTLKIIACREQHKKLSALEMDLAAAKQEGFTSKHSSDADGAGSKKRPHVVMGVLTSFGRKKNREAIRKAWMGSGATLKKMENEKGIVSRFVIGRSANRGDSLDRSIDDENTKTNDFIILDQLEAAGETPKKTKMFFAYAAVRWDADYYAKVNDDVFVNIDALGATLISHLHKPRAYIGCMKSGEVFSEPSQKWHEPDWWKFGDSKSYFRHASGEMYVISAALAKFVSINRSFLRYYAHDDVSAGSWFIGLDVEHVHDDQFCCSSWSTGAICSGV